MPTNVEELIDFENDMIYDIHGKEHRIQECLQRVPNETFL